MLDAVMYSGGSAHRLRGHTADTNGPGKPYVFLTFFYNLEKSKKYYKRPPWIAYAF
jgi:hypothetical protein